MSDLKALYQEVILDHNRNPRNYRKMENPDRFLTPELSAKVEFLKRDAAGK